MDESSHVRFQESDLDALDYSERNNNQIGADEEVEADVIEEEEQRVYSEVCDPPDQMCTTSVKRVHYREDVEPASRPMVRRRKRRERDSRRVRQEERRERRKENNNDEEEENENGFDWLAGTAGGSNRESEVLRAMVHKLSVELGREQGRRRETNGLQLAEEDEESSWLTELGGLVPLLVAYEEQLREVKAAKSELQQVVEKDQVGVLVGELDHDGVVGEAGGAGGGQHRDGRTAERDCNDR